jgi:hypothetical protein
MNRFLVIMLSKDDTKGSHIYLKVNIPSVSGVHPNEMLYKMFNNDYHIVEVEKI